MRFLATLVVVASATLVASPVATPQASTKIERRAALEAAVIHEMSRVRAAKGLHSLRPDTSLRSAARSHSQAMLAHGFFSHDSRDGTDFSERIRRYYTTAGFMRWSVGETLMTSERRGVDAQSVVAAWLDSPRHRVILLSPTWRDAGVGVRYAPSALQPFGGAETLVVTADFGLREGRAGSS